MHFRDKNRMFVRFHRDYWQEDKNRSFGDDVNGIILNRINRGIALDDVHVFSSSFLLNFRYGLTAQEFPEHRVSQGIDLATLGFSPNFMRLINPELATIPNTQVGALTQLSQNESGDGTTASLTHSFTGNFTWINGNHNVRFGPELRVYREFRNRYPNDVSPQLVFSNLWTRGPLDNSPVQQVGPEIASLLLGIPGGSMTRSGSYAEQDKYLGLYIHDDWKVTRKLTLNVGMRVEHESPITERFDRSATQFLADAASPIEAQAQANYARNPIPQIPVSAFRVRGGLSFAGVGSNPREYWDGQFLTWMPRFGFAYQALPKTVIRGGYGIFYGSIGVNKSNSNLRRLQPNDPHPGLPGQWIDLYRFAPGSPAKWSASSRRSLRRIEHQPWTGSELLCQRPKAALCAALVIRFPAGDAAKFRSRSPVRWKPGNTTADIAAARTSHLEST